MTKFLFAAAAASLAFAAPAFAAERQFTHEGVTYTYTATVKGDSRVLAGTASKGGRFKLVVAKGWIRGYMGNSRVSFAAPKGDIQLASR